MPSIVGPVQIISISDGVVQFGDALNISPKSTSKSTSGSGGGNSALFIIANNWLSASNLIDPNDVGDQDIVGNN